MIQKTEVPVPTEQLGEIDTDATRSAQAAWQLPAFVVHIDGAVARALRLAARLDGSGVQQAPAIALGGSFSGFKLPAIIAGLEAQS